jgi:hypothetical protein
MTSSIGDHGRSLDHRWFSMDGSSQERHFARKGNRMAVRNRWIDPRVADVGPKAAQAYLVRNGWKPQEADRSSMLPFAGPKAGKDPTHRPSAPAGAGPR